MSEVPVSPVQFSRPELKIDSAAINNEPVELDGTPTSQDKIKTLSNSIAKPLLLSDQQTIGPGSKRLTDAELKEMAKLISSRKADPAVMVDLPQTPQAEELAIVGAVGESTPLS